MNKLARLLKDESGVTAIEYGLICALICVAVIGGMKSLGGGSNGMWGKLDNHVADAMD